MWKVCKELAKKALPKAGCYVRAYEYMNCVSYVYLCNRPITYHWGVVAHLQRNTRQVSFELWHRVCGISFFHKDNIWKPVKADVWKKLFIDSTGRPNFPNAEVMDWIEHIIVETDSDGRMYFTVPGIFIMRNVMGISKNTIFNTPLAMFVDGNIGCNYIAVNYEFPDKVKNIEDARTISEALKETSSANNALYYRTLESERDDIMRKIRDCEKKIAEMNDKIQKIAESSADAMNELEERYGISVAF